MSSVNNEMMLRAANGGIARSTAMSSGHLPVFWSRGGNGSGNSTSVGAFRALLVRGVC